MITRRQFAATLAAASTARALPSEFACEVAVIGAGTGGCAAALAALRAGRRVVLTEETAWIGGQLTSQGVPPDEHPWIESFGGTQSYRAYREAVRAHYRRAFPLTAEARANRHLNPGGGLVSRITHEPNVSLAVLEEMLAPWVSAGQLVILRNHRPVAAGVTGDRVREVLLRDLQANRTRTLIAPYFIDATEQGDLLPLTGTEFVTGFESRRDTGEPSAPAEAQPSNIQSFTVCFAMSHEPGQHTIEKPREYAFWRDYVPQLKPAWPGKLLAWPYTHPITLEPRDVAFDPTADASSPGSAVNLWLYRRIRRRLNYTAGAGADITLVNWPHNDYWLGNLHGVTEAEATHHLERAKQLSLSLLYWMQTEAPRPDGKQGWPGLRLRHDIMGTNDGLAMYPYIRESRRIRAEFTVAEQHVSTKTRAKLLGKPESEVAAEPFPDSVGVGSYRIDLHPSSGGDNYIDVSSLPFQIPLGALIPRRVENLIAGGKNLGVTHITNGCYRLHPVEWNIGESAGALAAFALTKGAPPRAIRNGVKHLADFQAHIQAQGIEIAWPRLTPR